MDLEGIDPSRMERGIQIWKSGGVSLLAPSHWLVRSPGGTYLYDVERDDDGKWSCSCPDHVQRHQACKHILAVIVGTSTAMTPDLGGEPTGRAEQK